MLPIDFNADVAEGIGNEADLLPYLTSCNIACAEHAGSPSEMNRVVKLAIVHDVAIGAHPSYPDRKNFGRVELNLLPEEIYTALKKQLVLMDETCKKLSVRMSHVKPHGALYHRAASDPIIAELLYHTLKEVEKDAAIMGPENSEMHKVCTKFHHPFISEVFADRAYDKYGNLVSRSVEGSSLRRVHEVVDQALCIVQRNEVKTIDGDFIPMHGDSLCFHGDHPKAVEFLKACKRKLEHL